MDICRATDADAETLSALNADIQAVHAHALPGHFKPPSVHTFPPGKVRSLLAYPHVRIWICWVAPVLGSPDASEGVAGRRRDPATGAVPAGYVYAEIIRQGETSMRPATEYVYVHHLSVSLGHRRKGHGTALLRTVFDLAKTEGIAAVQLDVWAFNAEAQAFFARHGFTPCNLRLWRSEPAT